MIGIPAVPKNNFVKNRSKKEVLILSDEIFLKSLYENEQLLLKMCPTYAC